MTHGLSSSGYVSITKAAQITSSDEHATKADDFRDIEQAVQHYTEIALHMHSEMLKALYAEWGGEYKMPPALLPSWMPAVQDATMDLLPCPSNLPKCFVAGKWYSQEQRTSRYREDIERNILPLQDWLVYNSALSLPPSTFASTPRRNPVVRRRTSWGHDILILTKRQSKEPPSVFKEGDRASFLRQLQKPA